MNKPEPVSRWIEGEDAHVLFYEVGAMDEYVAQLVLERDQLVANKNRMRLYIQALIESESQAVTDAGLLKQQVINLSRETKPA